MHPVIVDIDIAENGTPVAFHVLDADDLNAMDTMKKVASGEIDIEKSGWKDATRLPGMPDGATRFDVLMLQAQKKVHADKLAPIVQAKAAAAAKV